MTKMSKQKFKYLENDFKGLSLKQIKRNFFEG